MWAARGRAGECPVSMPVGRVDGNDLTAELRQLREEQPICRVRLLGGETGWLTTSYELGRAVLADHRFAADRMGDHQPIGALQRSQVVTWRLGLSAVENDRDRIQQLIEIGLDALEQAGSPVDFMATFARPVSASMVCNLLGLTADEATSAVQMADGLLAPEFADDHADTLAALNDLLSDLIRDDSVTDQVLSDVIGASLAGYAKTATQFGFGLLTLLNHPSTWEELAGNPTSGGRIVEELLRHNTVFGTNPTTRFALADVEIGGALVIAGETVVVSLLAANRDPDQFPRPDEFLPEREAHNHLAFGGGDRPCVGRHLAREVLCRGFTALAHRFPALRLAVSSEEIRWLPDDHQLSGPAMLPVAW